MDTVATEVHDGILTVTLDRPDRLNAFTVGMQHDLVAAFDQADEDRSVRCVVVTGRGRAFCAGRPGRRGRQLRSGRRRRRRRWGGAGGPTPRQRPRPAPAPGRGRPGVAAHLRLHQAGDRRHQRPGGGGGRHHDPAHGHPPGGGVGPVRVRVRPPGLVPEAASSWFLPRLVGISRAAEWCYTGRVFGAEEARAAGLVRSVHPDGELLDAAYGLAGEIAAQASPVSVTLTRQMLWRMLGEPTPWPPTGSTRPPSTPSGRGRRDVREGVVSFLEKRPPGFPAGARRPAAAHPLVGGARVLIPGARPAVRVAPPDARPPILDRA